MPLAHPSPNVTPIIIIGGGPVGLTLSILLSLHHIPHTLFERHPTTSIHPKACGINQRTMEVFRTCGVEDAVYAAAAPPEVAGRTAWYTSLGEGGREIASRDAWGGGRYREEYEGFSPCRYAILPQIRLEPILMERARELNPEGICCGVEVLDVRDGEGKGRVEVRERESGVAAEYEARFILVADGGRSLTDKLGIAWLGEGSLFDMVTAHIKAPIRTLHPDPSNFITWFSNPSMGGSMRTGYLYQIGPWPFTSPSEEEWVFASGITESDPKEFSNEIMLNRIRRTLNIPSLDPKLLSLSHWTVNSLYASSWRQGRIFLVGDSAHRIPPFGALGMNTGIQDAANLVWKLPLALQNETKYSPLLDTYQEERLEVGRRVGLTSLNNMRSHVNAIDAAMGVSPSKTPAENVHEAEGFFSAHCADYAAKREAMSRAVKALDSEFKAPGLEVGWFYPSADLEGEGGATHGGQQTPSGELVSEFFFPSTIPGHHLPHAWVERAGERCAVRDLLALDGMTVFAGGADAVMAAPDERVKVVLVGEGNWSDGDGRWRELCGVGDKRGVVVRPDGIVAWRGELASLEREEWERLLDRLLRVPAS